MRYLSLCSGIEAASVACSGLDWEAVAFSEIEPFPCAVLNHHYPHVPNLSDMTKINGSEYHGKVDLIVGGTPCQSFSVAGKRGGISDPRGALALAFVGIVGNVLPRWIVWENVPGVLSSGEGADFKEFTSALVEIGYHVAWRVLDAQYFGVPQRRRRVFLVGHLGDWRPAAAVLFEPHSLRGHSAKSGKKAKDTTGTTKTGVGGGCEQPKTRTLNVTPINTQVATRGGALGGRTGFGVGAVGDIAYTLQSAHSHAVAVQNVMTFTQAAHGTYREGTGTIRASGGDIGGGSETIVTFAQNQLGEVRTSDVCGTIGTNSNASGRNTPMIHTSMQVRRLTPLECERLQGFPDNYTAVTYRNKNAADTPRYKALGNSMAVPVMRYIFQRLHDIDKKLLDD